MYVNHSYSYSYSYSYSILISTFIPTEDFLVVTSAWWTWTWTWNWLPCSISYQHRSPIHLCLYLSINISRTKRPINYFTWSIHRSKIGNSHASKISYFIYLADNDPILVALSCHDVRNHYHHHDYQCEIFPLVHQCAVLPCYTLFGTKSCAWPVLQCFFCIMHPSISFAASLAALYTIIIILSFATYLCSVVDCRTADNISEK